MFPTKASFITLGGLLAAISIGLASSAAQATVISDNTGNTTSNVEAASSSRYLAATFTTDGSSHTLNSAMLLMSLASATGSAQLALYADVGTTASPGLEPGTLIATLDAPATFTATTGPNTFTTSGVTLAPNTTYWLVLKPTSGTFNWAWTAANTGSGTGFTHVWGVSEDTGAFWWSSDFFPLQFAVTVDACTAPTIATPPMAASVACSANAQLSVTAGGSGTLNYAWKRNDMPLTDSAHIGGSATSTLTITGTTRADPGAYTVTITNSCGSITSAPVTLNVCIADYNCSGAPDVQDIFDYMTAWFAADPLADINLSGGLSVQDIFDFLSAWFAGC